MHSAKDGLPNRFKYVRDRPAPESFDVFGFTDLAQGFIGQGLVVRPIGQQAQGDLLRVNLPECLA